MAVARLVNWPDTMAELQYPAPWQREHFIPCCKHGRREATRTKVAADGGGPGALGHGATSSPCNDPGLESDRLRSPRQIDPAAQFHFTIGEARGGTTAREGIVPLRSCFVPSIGDLLYALISLPRRCNLLQQFRRGRLSTKITRDSGLLQNCLNEIRHGGGTNTVSNICSASRSALYAFSSMSFAWASMRDLLTVSIALNMSPREKYVAERALHFGVLPRMPKKLK